MFKINDRVVLNDLGNQTFGNIIFPMNAEGVVVKIDRESIEVNWDWDNTDSSVTIENRYVKIK